MIWRKLGGPFLVGQHLNQSYLNYLYSDCALPSSLIGHAYQCVLPLTKQPY